MCGNHIWERPLRTSDVEVSVEKDIIQMEGVDADWLFGVR